MILPRWLTFLLRFQTMILKVLLFWIYLFLLVFVLQWLPIHWEILIMLLCQFPLSFHWIHNKMPCFIACLMTILVLIEIIFVIIWEMFHLRISLNLVLLLLLVNFASGFRLGLIYIYITQRKYQVKPHSSPWFSTACAAAIVHRNHFFRLYQKDKSSDSKVKFRQTSNRCKSNRCLLHLIKQNCLLKTFLRTLILMTQVSPYLISLLELIWNFIISVYLPRWLERS